MGAVGDRSRTHVLEIESMTWRTSLFPEFPKMGRSEGAISRGRNPRFPDPHQGSISSSGVGSGFVAAPQSITFGPIADVVIFGVSEGSRYRGEVHVFAA